MNKNQVEKFFRGLSNPFIDAVLDALTDQELIETLQQYFPHEDSQQNIAAETLGPLVCRIWHFL